jgi:hypothetical protein
VTIDKVPSLPHPSAFAQYNAQPDHDRARQPRSYNDGYATRSNTQDANYHAEYRRQREQDSFLKGHVEACLETLQEDDMIMWYKSFDSYCSLTGVPLISFQQVAKGSDLYPTGAPADQRARYSQMISIKLNQSNLIKDPIAKSIKNARAGRNDGYGALYALLAASIPRLQVNKMIPTTGSNKPPVWDPTLMNLYHYESKIQDYIKYQATKGRYYTDQEATQFFLEGLATGKSKRFQTALVKAIKTLEKTPEGQALPMDYCLGQLAQTIAELALSNREVGTDALTLVGDATVRMTTVGEMKYTRAEDKDKQRGDNKFRRKPFCRPKLELQCPGCKLWGHDDSTCDFLARTFFAIAYFKKTPNKAEQIAAAFGRRNTKEAKAFIKTLRAYPNGPPTSLLPHAHPPTNETYDDDEDTDKDYFIEDYLGTLINGFGLSIKTAAVPVNISDHTEELLCAVHPLALQTIKLPPFPSIQPPVTTPDDVPHPHNVPHPHTVPVVCSIQSQTTPAQADSGANRAITDDISLLHNSRQLDKPFPVGSIDASNKIY